MALITHKHFLAPTTHDMQGAGETKTNTESLLFSLLASHGRNTGKQSRTEMLLDKKARPGRGEQLAYHVCLLRFYLSAKRVFSLSLRTQIGIPTSLLLRPPPVPHPNF